MSAHVTPLRMLQQFETVTATFEPLRRDDLCEEAKEAIGMRCKWQAMWVIERGEYLGQWAMCPNERLPGFAWVPECDLNDVEKQP